MKRLLATLIPAVLVAPALAADNDAPVFDKGPVWSIQEIRTKDGHFNDYMKWLATEWKAQEEALKKEGDVVDYKVLLVQGPRADEPDIMLATAYKNQAVFDRSTAEDYALQQKISGSIAKADQGQSERGAIRTILSQIDLREAKLK